MIATARGEVPVKIGISDDNYVEIVQGLRDGEEVRGIIEWYDRNCIKVNRENGDPNLMIYKPAIKYMFKEGENQR